MLSRFMHRFQRRVITGLIFIVPIMVTVYVTEFLFGFFSGGINPIIERLHHFAFAQRIFGTGSTQDSSIRFVLGVPIALILLYLIGFVSNSIIIRKLYGFGESLLLRIPVLKSVYGLTKEIIEMATNRQNPSFRYVARFPYPTRGSYALGFVTGESRFTGDERVYANILMPVSPIPTHLFLAIVPVDDVDVIDISIQEGLKLVMSGGVVVPERMKITPYLQVVSQPTIDPAVIAAE